MKAMAVVIILGMLMIVSLLPVHADAAETTWFRSYYPPSNNATYYTITGKPYGVYSTDATKVAEDDLTKNLGTASDGIIRVHQTNDFTNDGAWVPMPNDTAFTSVGHMPVPGANILSVSVHALFAGTFPESTYFPEMYLQVSLNNKSSWSSSSLIAGGIVPATGYSASWNVTGLTTWTPELLNSTYIWAQLRAYPLEGYDYLLDYLGFIVLWSAEVEGGGTGWIPGTDPEEDSGSWEPNYWFITDEGGIIGILGFIGMIGMIGVPAYAVIMWKRGDEDKMSVFVKTLVVFMFCFAMFLAALTGT